MSTIFPWSGDVDGELCLFDGIAVANFSRGANLVRGESYRDGQARPGVYRTSHHYTYSCRLCTIVRYSVRISAYMPHQTLHVNGYLCVNILSRPLLELRVQVFIYSVPELCFIGSDRRQGHSYHFCMRRISVARLIHDRKSYSYPEAESMLTRYALSRGTALLRSIKDKLIIDHEGPKVARVTRTEEDFKQGWEFGIHTV